ncbi:hypothetical protein MMC30_008869 [Trapelia coarctata]|nr:hypothetical protein [Trapelia coarctata]
MVAPLSHPTLGTTILLFGPHFLSFNEESFDQLRSTLLDSPGHRWMLHTIAELTGYWATLSKAFPSLQTVPGAKLLADLNDWLVTGSFTQATFPLPNILLTPLVVITQLTQYSRYLTLARPDSRDKHTSFQQNSETLGFCTGLLSALVVSSSGNQAQFQQHGANAIRLAMLIGAVVDAQDTSANFHGESTSFSAAWNSPESGAEMTWILKGFPEAYVSVIFDEKRATVTTSKSTASSLLQQLKAVGVTAAEVALRGRFHSQCHRDDVEAFIKFCDSNSAFQLADASGLVLPTRSNSGGDYITQGKLHHIALRSILVDQACWYQTFTAVQSSQLTDTESLIVCFGLDRCVPPSLMRRLGQRLIQVADLGNDTSRLSASVGDPQSTMQHKRYPSDNDIAVVGMACKVPGADDLEEFWKLLCEGKSQHVEVPEDRFGFETVWRDVDPKRKWYGNFINDQDAFNHKFFKKSPRELASMDPQQRLMLQVAYQAVEQSGYFQSPNRDNQHIGCYIGVSNVDYEGNIACYPAGAFSATGTLKSFVAGKISHHFGWTGPGLTIDTACSASAVAVHQACKGILSGDCTAALAGGVNIMTSPLWYQNLAGASFLSPTGPCKPFDAKADGYCRGEGSGAVYLKKLSAAIADGDQILGVIAGTAVRQNQNFTAITVPNAESLSDLFRDVTRQAQLEPKQISVVEAHGTGTPVGDPAEYESLRRVFGGSIRSKSLSMGSVKGLVGHTECASGIVALIKMLLMVQESAIPPQASFDTINPAIKASPSDNMEIVTKLKPWDVDFRAALINNYGASGSNASMVVTEAPTGNRKGMQTAEMQSAGRKHPFWFCGLDEQSLRAYSARFRRFLRSKTVSAKNLSVANLAFNVSRQSNRSLGQALIFSCSSIEELEQKLAAFDNGDKTVSSIARQSSRPVILCFGGQISTFIGLNRQVYESVKVLRTYLDQCDLVCQSIGLDGIYPEIFERTPVEDTVKLQTMLFAIQYSCAKTWMDCGIEVEAIVGHSFGELTALCVSGVLSLNDAVKLIAGRARLIRDSWGSDNGAMAAVEANRDDVEKLLAESNKSYQQERTVTIACFNGPRNFTLAGPAKSIDAVLETVVKNPAFSSCMKTKKLNVTNAFHSTLVEPLMADLEKVAQDLTFREPTIPLQRATEFESLERLTPRFAAEHMRYPVYFNHAVQRLSKRYPSAVWLEAGSNSTITTMANRALGSSSTSHFQPVNITSDGGLQYLTDTTTNLWKQGLSVSFWPHHSLQAPEYAPLLLPPYQFEKSRHWMELKKPQKGVVEPVGQRETQEELPKGLWTFVGYQDSNQRSARFRINTMLKKFEDYVAGHTVAHSAPLCPSTLQLDIVIEALLSLRPDFAASNLQPQLQCLDNHAPLCIDSSRVVWLDVETSDADLHTWNWKMVSNAVEGGANTNLHVSGKIVFRSVEDAQFLSDFARYERLVTHERCMRLLEDNDADDVIKGRNIYKTFANVVDYGEIYRGVRKVVGKNNESAGRVVKPYTGETWLDTPLCDSFCQVAGIFVNCMTDRSDKDVCISNRIEQLIRSPRIRAGDSLPETWHVFAVHHRPSDKIFLSDVFVFDPRNGALLGVILGIQYQKVSRVALGKVLARLTPGTKKTEEAIPSTSGKLETAEPSPSAKNSKTAQAPAAKKKGSSRPDISGSVRNLLANVSGLEPDEIKDNTGLVDIGIDSLMGMELAREIETVFKCTLDTSELMDLTDFASLMKCIKSALGPIGDDASAEEEKIVEDNEEPESQSGGIQPAIEELTGKEMDDKIDRHTGGASASQASSAPGTPNSEEEAPTANDISRSTTPESVHNSSATILGEFGNSKKEIQTTDRAARQAAVDEYVRKYTQEFFAPVRTNKLNTLGPSDQCVLITGATGSLGSHLVAHFAELPNVKTVVCLNRCSSTEPTLRQRQALESRGISLGTTAVSKLKVFETDTSKPNFGLQNSEYEILLNTVTHIVHNAWPMSIKRPLKAFETQFQAMRNLVDLTREISCKRPPGSKVGFQFISSIATVGLHPLWSGQVCVPEERMTVESALPSGYSDAKLVCERMLDETLQKYPDHYRPMVARIGQIAGSRTSGYWNPMEHISFLIKSSQTLKALPNFEGELSWCPVNDVSATLGDLLVSDTTPYPIYHVENPARQPWRDMMAVLADELDIPPASIIPFDDWLNRVREHSGSVETENPAKKILEFFDEHFLRMACGGLVLNTTRSREHSKTLASGEPVSADLARRYVQAWKEMGFLHD